MTCKLKAIGVVLVAVFAISALAAPTAQAQFAVEGGGTATVAASGGMQVVRAAFGAVRCKN